jgi:hypothetical protein
MFKKNSKLQIKFLKILNEVNAFFHQNEITEMKKNNISIKKIFILIFPLLAFIILRSIFLTPVPSDETIYINMAKALKKGLLPYKDFFYAHPPIQLFLLFPVAQSGNFFFIKIYISTIGLACILLTYLISKKIFDERSAFISLLFFLFSPAFIIFGNIAMGTFEALLFFLLSFLFLIKGRIFISSVFMSLSLYTRYLIILLLPLILFYIFKYNRKIFEKYFTYLSLNLFFIFILIYSIFGQNFIRDTILYHIVSNIKIDFELSKSIWQYILLGFFHDFILITSLIYGYLKKDYKLLILSIYPLIYDLTILLTFKQVAYHYFAFMLPFLSIVYGRAFSYQRPFELKIFLILILLLSWITNLKSIIYFFDKSKNILFDKALNYTLSLEKTDTIFGNPIIVNYVSFISDISIFNNYFDSDLKHLYFEGLEKVIEEVKIGKPKLIFVDANYYKLFDSVIKNEYKKIDEFIIPGYYNFILFEKS